MTALPQIIVAPKPFRSPTAQMTAEERWTIAEMITAAVVAGHLTKNEAASPRLVVLVHGREVPRALWPFTRPKRGTIVEVKIRPAGGGGGRKNPLRTILMLMVVVAVAWISGGGLAADLGMSAALFGAGQTGAMVAASVASIALNALVNAIAPIPQPEQKQRSTSYTIDGARNAADPYGPSIMVLGQHRVTPRLAMRYFTDMAFESGRDVMYLYMLVQWHVGQCDLSQLKIGETDLSTYQGVTIEHRLLGEDYLDEISLIDHVVVEDADVQIELKGGVWHTRTTARDTVKISLDLAFPSGIFKVDDGYYRRVQLTFGLEYRAVGDVTWIGVPTSANPTANNGMQSTGVAFFDRVYVDLIRRKFEWTVAKGQYEVRVKRTTADTTDKNQTDNSFWLGLRSHLEVVPVLDNALCVSALKIKASDQLNGMLDNLNGLVAARVPVWDGTDWDTVEPSSNPGALLRWLYTGDAISPVRRMTAANLEEDTFENFFDYCETKEVACNAVIDYAASVEELAQLIASCGYASAGAVLGRRTVIVDDSKVPTQLFTSETVRNFRGKIVYLEPVHALRCAFINSEAGYAPDELIVYADGYDETTATKFQSAEFPGKVTHAEVWPAARRLLKRAEIRRIGYEFEVDTESLTTRHGHRALVEHFALRREAMSGRVTALILDGTDVIGVQISETVTMHDGTDYGLQLRRGEDGVLPLFDVLNDAGPGDPVTTNELMFDGPALEEFAPAVGDLVVWGDKVKMTRDVSVIHVAPDMDDYTAALTCVPYSEDLFADDEVAAPAFQSLINPRQSLGIVINPVVSQAEILRRLGDALAIGSAASGDGNWTPGEKSVLVPLLKELINSQSALDTRATALGITTEKTAFDSAMTALNAYLATLVTPTVEYQWDDYSGDTEVTAATFNPLFRDAMEKRNALQAKIDELNANALVPLGANQVPNTTFTPDLAGWSSGWNGTIGAVANRGINDAGKFGYNNTQYTKTSTTPANNTVFDSHLCVNLDRYSPTELRRASPRAVAGNRIYVSAFVAANASIKEMYVNAAYIDGTGTFLSEQTAGSITSSIPTGADGNPANYVKLGGFLTCPANTQFVLLYVRGVCNGGAAPAFWFMKPQVCVVAAGQTVPPVYTEGPALFGTAVTALNGNEQVKNNRIVGPDANRIRFSEGERPTIISNFITAAAAGVTAIMVTKVTNTGRNGYRISFTTDGAKSVAFRLGWALAQAVRLTGGERYCVSVISVASANVSVHTPGVAEYNAAGTQLTTNAISSATGAFAGQKWASFFTAQATAAFGCLYHRVDVNAAGNHTVDIFEPMFTAATSDQTVFPPYRVGLAADGASENKITDDLIYSRTGPDYGTSTSVWADVGSGANLTVANGLRDLFAGGKLNLAYQFELYGDSTLDRDPLTLGNQAYAEIDWRIVLCDSAGTVLQTVVGGTHVTVGHDGSVSSFSGWEVINVARALYTHTSGAGDRVLKLQIKRPNANTTQVGARNAVLTVNYILG